jgi:ABC-type uncharacterized transport system involved in gliding motility auxiliary subunit
MSPPQASRPSFSALSRWRIGSDMVLRTLLVLAVAGMVNYLGTRFYHRFYLSAQTRVDLSSRTLTVLRSVTNHVEVILYYDTRDPRNFYPSVLALLEEYHAHNPRISVRTVDYERDPGEALKVKDLYRKFFNSQEDKDLVIFDCAGKVKVFPGTALLQYKDSFLGNQPLPENPQKKQLQFERRPVLFKGEQAFTSILLALANPEPLKAYFLQGHGEASLSDSEHQQGFLKFASVLQENYLSITNLWLESGGVPADCSLLVIAAPDRPFEEAELLQLGQYLQEGGRLLLLFSYASQAHPTGLEACLQPWGVGVMADIAQDYTNSTTSQGYDMIIQVNQFDKHPVMDSLSQLQLHLYLPRPILPNPASQSANAPQVSVLFGTSPGATLMGNPGEPPHAYALACAIEQKPVAGVANPRGNTRIIVVGDATFLGNLMIDSGGNRDFLNAAVNWLCDRPLLLGGIGPRPITDLHLQITQHEQRQLGWLLLGALPGAVLFFGWIVWFVRRR